MKKRICVVTSSRAEYGLLKNIIFKLKEKKDIELTLVVTGSHLYKKHGYTCKEIENDGLNFVRLPIIMKGNIKNDVNITISDAVKKFSTYFSNSQFDLLIVLGDRYEILAVAIAAKNNGIDIAHISGGDITKGSLDDIYRNCITQMSTLHFPGCEESKKRIISMGINKRYVFNVGELGVENCIKIKTLTKEQLKLKLNFDFKKDYALVTYHPETIGKINIKKEMGELISALKDSKLNCIITESNIDAGGNIINNIWKKEVKKHNNWFFVASLGTVNYISCMKYAKMVIGNSSSGIFEAPAVGTPTVNIGNRQKGRKITKSIICCECERKAIAKSIKKANNSGNLIKNRYYGNGNTSNKIVSIIHNYLF